MRRGLKVVGIPAQKQQHIDIVPRRQLAAGVDHFIHGDGEGAFIGANHPRQRAAGFEAFVAEPSTGAEGAPRCAANSLIEVGQAAGGNGAQFFQGDVGGGDLHERSDVTLQYHHRLAGVFFLLHRCLSGSSRCDNRGLRNGGSGRLTA
ncbi:hypothetical protein D3C85_1132920 [compost metagenome]